MLRDGSVKNFTVRLEEQVATRVADASRTEAGEKVSTVLGFRADELTAETAQKLKLKPSSGKVVITAMAPASNAYRAGLRPGDLILSVNKQEVTSLAGYNANVKNLKKGDLLFLLVERAGSKIYFAFNV